MIRQLWRLRLLVALGVIAAAAIALLVGFHVSLSPLKVTQKSSSFGAAQQSLLIDTPRSSLVERPRGFGDLIGRAEVVGRLANTDAVKARVARRMDTAPGRITVEGPNPNGPQFQSAEPSAQQRANPVLGEAADFSVLIDTDPEAPVVTLFAQAKTGAEAVRLCNAMADALTRSVERLVRDSRTGQEQQVRDAIAALPPEQRADVNAAERRNQLRQLLSEGTRIRQLGAAVGGNASDQTGKAIVLAAFVGLVAAWCVFLLIVSGLARSGRRR